MLYCLSLCSSVQSFPIGSNPGKLVLAICEYQNIPEDLTILYQLLLTGLFFVYYLEAPHTPRSYKVLREILHQVGCIKLVSFAFQLFSFPTSSPKHSLPLIPLQAKLGGNFCYSCKNRNVKLSKLISRIINPFIEPASLQNRT